MTASLSSALPSSFLTTLPKGGSCGPSMESWSSGSLLLSLLTLLFSSLKGDLEPPGGQGDQGDQATVSSRSPTAVLPRPSLIPLLWEEVLSPQSPLASLLLHTCTRLQPPAGPQAGSPGPCYPGLSGPSRPSIAQLAMLLERPAVEADPGKAGGCDLSILQGGVCSSRV